MSKFKRVSVVSLLLFNINITHLYCRKLMEKENLKKEISNCTKTKCHLIIFFLNLISVLESKNENLK